MLKDPANIQIVLSMKTVEIYFLIQFPPVCHHTSCQSVCKIFSSRENIESPTSATVKLTLNTYSVLGSSLDTRALLSVLERVHVGFSRKPCSDTCNAIADSPRCLVLIRHPAPSNTPQLRWMTDF